MLKEIDIKMPAKRSVTPKIIVKNFIGVHLSKKPVIKTEATKGIPTNPISFQSISFFADTQSLQRKRLQEYIKSSRQMPLENYQKIIETEAYKTDLLPFRIWKKSVL